MSASNEVRKAVRKYRPLVEAQGWRVEERQTHWRFYPADRSLPFVTLHKSPSDSRWLANFRGDLRRSGFREE